VLHGSQGICDQFPGDPWIHFCNGYFEVWCYVKNNRGASLRDDMFILYDW
jgi:hypothetical protein